MGEKDTEEPGNDEQTSQRRFQPLQFLTLEGVVTASILIYITLQFPFLIPGLNRHVNYGSNFTVYALLMCIVYSILIGIAIYLLVKIWKKVLRNEWKSFLVFAAGALILFFLPLGASLEILPGYHKGLDGLHIFLLVLGILVCIVGMVLMARDGAFFSIWFLGASFYWILTFHEAFKFIIHNQMFGPYDRTLNILALSILLASFVLYVLFELKFMYLSYLVDRALEKNKEKEYEVSLEILDKALQIHPAYATALNNKGNVLFRSKNYEEARECYLKVLKIDPDYLKAKNNLQIVNKKLKITNSLGPVHQSS